MGLDLCLHDPWQKFLVRIRALNPRLPNREPRDYHRASL